MAKYDPDSWPACWILSLIAQDNIHAFYTSKLWKRFKRKILTTRPCRCQLCEQKRPAILTPLRRPWENKTSPTDDRPVATVHHVNEVRRRPDLALSEYDETGCLNVVIVCPSCHWDEHHKRNDLMDKIPERW